ncbi:MAG: LysM domain-containing protein [Bacilli bacterium]|nr:LysM domain-containing protein [Bacilli bacterium]MDD3304856.1 LysM domain-containing protein [Bacilli bacterium]MDD4053701.1 LysM domain-containing protein [Bacilli bacterium]MDD4411572.1 LysM domain-containing protein [Bacilli bacterium]
MKKIVSFKKDIPFNTKIGEITSISLEHNVKMIELDHISGEFIVSGDYKVTDVSVNREPFSYNLPFDIALDTKYNADKAKVEIDDFYFEITNEQILNVNIDVLIDGIEIVDDFDIEKESEIVENENENLQEIRTAKDKINNVDYLEVEEDEIIDLFKEIETPPIDIEIEGSEEKNMVEGEKIKSLFDSFDDSNETFTTYHVHIVRESDTIDSIVTKYNTTREEVIAYNKIDELKLGDKIVIPAVVNE